MASLTSHQPSCECTSADSTAYASQEAMPACLQRCSGLCCALRIADLCCLISMACSYDVVVCGVSSIEGAGYETQVSWLDHQGGNLGHSLGDNSVCPDRPRAAAPQTQVADLVVSGCGRQGKCIYDMLYDYINYCIPLWVDAIYKVLRMIATALLHLDSFASDLHVLQPIQ